MNTINKDTVRWKPGVPKSALLLIAGIMWLLVGMMLNGLAFSWLRIEKADHALLAWLTGFVGSLFIHHFGFLRIVDKNLHRILPMEGRRCVFSFMPWKSYFLILAMVGIGVLLRHSPLPKLYLSVIYTGIGTALILSSIRYLRFLILTLRERPIKSSHD